MTTVKIWSEKPSHEAVQELLKTFFAHLRAGELDAAKGLVEHEFPDWDESIHLLWQDHHLIHASAKDSSFEGREWQTDVGWLKDLTIKDTFEWMKDDLVWVDLVFKGEPSGYIGEFAVKSNAAGFYVQRVIFKMA